jgi:2-polyprenyl-3-methyl-5-hydroxy-6-metoxy-1,4-benzoquinol methylase
MHEGAKTSPPPDPAVIFEAAQGFQRSFLVKAAVDLDLFTEIAKGSDTAPDIARACKGSERGVRILCDSLTVLGLMAKEGGRYSLTPDTAFFLDSRSPAYLGKAFEFILHPTHLENVRRLAEVVRGGQRGAPHDTLAPEDPIWIDFARGMAPLMIPAAQAIAQLLQPLLAATPSPRVLDIAAGHGIFGITVAQQLPGVQIYAVDWANVLEVARENAQACGVSARHHLIPGSAFDVDFGSGYHAALVTNFLHHFAPPANVTLLKKAGAALNRGGHLVILEFVPNDDRVSPRVPALFSVTMLSNTPQGDAYTYAELSAMCRSAGFEEVRLVQLAHMPQSLVVARKP